MMVALAGFSAGAANPMVVDLWEKGKMPYDNQETRAEEINELGQTRYVSNPQLYIYTPSNFGIRKEANAGVALVSCPGGGYSMESVNAANDLADWYTSQGITFAVLKYRMPNGGHYDATMADVDKAMRIMREFAAEHDIEKVGIMGASAGGHLASTQATHYKDSITRPDFQVLFYPVITLDPSYTHKGTRLKWLGKNPEAGLEEKYSNHKQVTADTPPAIILGCYDDKVVPIQNSIDYFMALRKNNVQAAMYIYPEGDHGWGHIHSIRYKKDWHDDLASWLSKEVISKVAGK